jgi:hypothetical protein
VGSGKLLDMRRLSAAVVCTGFLLLTVTPARGDPRFHGGRVYVAYEACAGQKYRPSRITIACGDGGFFATNIRYRFYGGKRAEGTAELNTHSCVPNCAQSAFHAFPGTVVLVDVVRCEGTLYYSQIRYRFAHAAPYGEPRSGRASIKPLYEVLEDGSTSEIHCSSVLG